MIKFIYENNNSIVPPGFSEVENSQFFVDSQGRLCQKCSPLEFNIICLPGGTPFGVAVELESHDDFFIQKVLPKVIRIEF